MALAERFNKKWEPVTESGGWIWVAGIKDNGYGQINANGKTKSAHRLSWELHNGAIPDGSGSHGTCVLHKCDVKSCVNPDHLFLGTQQENMSDKCSKNRQSRIKGESNPQSKLTDSLVIEIRRSTSTHREIALRYGISMSQVWVIKHRKNWRHI